LDFDTLLGIGLLAATVAVAVGTVGLWLATKSLASFAEESVRLTRESLHVAEAQLAPRLVLRRSSRNVDEASAEGQILVENVGGGAAHDVTVETSWGLAPVDNPVLQPEKQSVARAQLTRADWDQRRGTEEEDPTPHRVRFVDARGQSQDVPAQPTAASMWVATAR
jgi:hypothetical protein